MSIIIRQATLTDMPAVLDIINHEILHETSIYDYDPRTLEEQETIFKEKELKNLPFLVAEKLNTIVGFGTYGTFRNKVAYRFTAEHSVYVNRAHTGNGIGSLLLKELIEVARLQGIHTLIGVIDSENTGSLAFHERLGFEQAGFLKETGYKFDRWLHSVFVQLILRDE